MCIDTIDWRTNRSQKEEPKALPEMPIAMSLNRTKNEWHSQLHPRPRHLPSRLAYCEKPGKLSNRCMTKPDDISVEGALRLPVSHSSQSAQGKAHLGGRCRKSGGVQRFQGSGVQRFWCNGVHCRFLILQYRTQHL